MKVLTNNKGLVLFYVLVVLVSVIYSSRVDALNELDVVKSEIVNNY